MSFSATSPVVYTLADQGPVFERRVRQGLGLAQLVSLAGSEWTRSVGDDLGLTQSEFFVEALSNTLSLTSQAAAVVDRVAAATSAMSLIHVNPVAGGRIDGGGVETIEAIFDSSADKGHAVFVSSSGHVDLAQANAEPDALAIGLAAAPVLSGQPGEIITSGPFTNDEWSLTPMSVYYLDPNVAGGITATYPTDVGDFVIIMGVAITATQINLEIHWANYIGA